MYRIICSALLVALAISLTHAASASAGTYVWLSCANGNVVGSAQQRDHVSVHVAASGGYADPCYQNNNHTDSYAAKNDLNTLMRVEAPSGTSIQTLNLDAVGNNYAYERGWGYLVDGVSAAFFCSRFVQSFPAATTCGQGVSAMTTNGPKAFTFPAKGVPFVQLGNYCHSQTGCSVGTLDLKTNYLSVELRDEEKPTLGLAGDAWSASPLSGTPTLSYTATDNAAGTQGIRVLVDGSEIASTVNSDSLGCDNQRWHLCPDDQGSIGLPLGGISDGTHVLTVQSSDAVGNEAERSRSVLVDNAPPSVGDVKVGGSPQEGRTLTCSATVSGQSPRTAYQWVRTAADGSGPQAISGATDASYELTESDVGRKVLCRVTGTDGGGSTVKSSTPTAGPFANGAVVVAAASSPGATGAAGSDGANGASGSNSPSGSASANAVAAATAALAAVPRCTTSTLATFGLGTSIRRSYSRSRVRLSGRLRGAGGKPSVGHVLQIVQTVVRSGSVQRKRIGSVRTTADGRFKITVGRGPSRALQLVEEGCGAVGRVITERVRGAVRARTTTRRVRNRQTARIRGRVLGGYVGRGIPVELQVKVGRKWRDVKHAQTNSRGEFKLAYRFSRTFVRYTYRFRIVTRAGGAWPYMPAKSRIVKVRVN